MGTLLDSFPREVNRYSNRESTRNTQDPVPVPQNVRQKDTSTRAFLASLDEEQGKKTIKFWRGEKGVSTLTAIMATNGDMPSDDESGPESPSMVAADNENDEVEETAPLDQPRSALKKSEPLPEIKRPELPEQPDPENLDTSKLTPLSPEIIARQATINIGTIGHVAHGKSTVVKAISGVQTVRFKNELERNITIKLGYANAKIYKCDNEACPRPTCYKSYKSEKEVDPPCESPGCGGRYRLVRHVS